MPPVPIAVVLLVDPRGWVLLQERDADAPRAANQWGMVGGHVEDGEAFEPAAYRELAEETGLALAPGTLQLWRDEVEDQSVVEHDEQTRGRRRLHRVGGVAGTGLGRVGHQLLHCGRLASWADSQAPCDCALPSAVSSPV